MTYVIDELFQLGFDYIIELFSAGPITTMEVERAVAYVFLQEQVGGAIDNFLNNTVIYL